ncbi:TonB-dependent siderophore receptor [Pedobacter yulinensis]|uniref:TonB-dependent siderophore receptor n=1 Tax=Pedobacter yulinensis TaxID=2126353 RepID=A0A2T3HR74_9SPHI|nr:TonB-dependent receptor [Pedobacter yulinensis]PST84929.1 TonB-dependent siderophore receptor [Pedobacter yulinensis]
MLKTIFTIVICFCFSWTALAQQPAGSIEGRIITADGEAASGVTVRLKGKGLETYTDDAGRYHFLRLRAGTYVVRVSAIGLKATEQTVSVTAGAVQADFSLSENLSQLEDIHIRGERANKFAVKSSEGVARMPLTNLENPQVYTSISKDLMKEQVVVNLSDALKNSSGIDKLWSSTGRAGDGAAFYQLRGFTIQPSMVNGIASLTNGDIDPVNIEKIEVIKGPSGTLFGGALTNFGGLLNLVTKRPQEQAFGELGYTTGSFRTNRLTADLTGPINQKKTLLARVNAAYHNQESFQDAGFRKTLTLSPAIEYRISERTRLNLYAEFYQAEATNPLMVFLNRSRALIARSPEALNMDFSKSYTNNDITVKTPSTNLNGVLTHRLSEQWRSQTSFSQSYRKSDGLYQYVMFIGPTDAELSRYVAYLNAASSAFNLQQNFTGDFKIGGLRNRVVIGVDYLAQRTVNANSPYIVFDKVSTLGNPANYASMNRQAIESRLAASTAAPTKGRNSNYVYSAYVSDVLNLSETLMAMLSLRVDRFDNKPSFDQVSGNSLPNGYLQTAFSPKFGLVYQVLKDRVSLFGNYMNGFKNVAPVVQPVPDVSGIFKPQQANQVEGGVKLDLLNGRLGMTASYYDIRVDNMTRSEQIVRNGTPLNITVQDGAQKSSGFEIDLQVNPISGLNIVAGYSHNNSKMTRSAANVEGLRPVSAGPADLANVWISYQVQGGPLEGLGAGLGGNYAGKNLITNNTVTGAFTIPAYTVANATLFYNFGKYRLGVKADNLTNERYFKGWTTIEPQLPRSVLANLSLRF